MTKRRGRGVVVAAASKTKMKTGGSNNLSTTNRAREGPIKQSVGGSIDYERYKAARRSLQARHP
jgi:hypothetical protein